MASIQRARTNLYFACVGPTRWSATKVDIPDLPWGQLADLFGKFASAVLVRRVFCTPIKNKGH